MSDTPTPRCVSCQKPLTWVSDLPTPGWVCLRERCPKATYTSRPSAPPVSAEVVKLRNQCDNTAMYADGLQQQAASAPEQGRCHHCGKVGDVRFVDARPYCADEACVKGTLKLAVDILQPLPASARTVTRYFARELFDATDQPVPTRIYEPVVLYAEVAALLTELEEKDYAVEIQRRAIEKLQGELLAATERPA